ncbi:MAG: ABC transporter permease [Bdellovibrionales bacterium]|nr:ABC transporter permease [Ramlibacter sp.]
MRYIVQRLIGMLLTALAATVVIFLISSKVPGDPVLAQLGDLAAADPAIVKAFRDRWRLDDPLPTRYWSFLTHLAQGDLGMSISTQRPVMDDIRQYAPATIELATSAFLLSILIGVPLGIAAGVWRDSPVDHMARLISLLGVSAPTFWLAFIALSVFYGGLQIAPGPGRLDVISIPPVSITGLYTIDAAIAGDWAAFRDALAHLALPSIVLAAATMGLITRTTRASMLDTLNQDYVRVARSKGLTETHIVLRHALPNALLPIVTLAGIAYAILLTGAVMTETIFSWPGLGRYTFRSAVTLDVPAIMGITLIVAVVYLVINFITDLSYLVLDPRSARR